MYSFQVVAGIEEKFICCRILPKRKGSQRYSRLERSHKLTYIYPSVTCDDTTEKEGLDGGVQSKIKHLWMHHMTNVEGGETSQGILVNKNISLDVFCIEENFIGTFQFGRRHHKPEENITNYSQEGKYLIRHFFAYMKKPLVWTLSCT